MTEDTRTDPPAGEPAPAAQAAGTAAEDANAEGTEATAEDGDVRRKFREALDRKSGKSDDPSGGEGRGNSKIHGAHGPAKAQRTFRRKSG